MKEKDVTAAVLRIAKKWLANSAALEIKLCKESSLPFSALQDHQEQALWHAKHDCLVFKIPDMGYRNPFDAFLLRQAEALVVVVFWEPNRVKEAVFIDIDDWRAERAAPGRKSLTRPRAHALGRVYEL